MREATFLRVYIDRGMQLTNSNHLDVFYLMALARSTGMFIDVGQREGGIHTDIFGSLQSVYLWLNTHSNFGDSFCAV